MRIPVRVIVFVCVYVVWSHHADCRTCAFVGGKQQQKTEPETALLMNLTAENDFDAFISFHSGVKHIYIPFAGEVLFICSESRCSFFYSVFLSFFISSVISLLCLNSVNFTDAKSRDSHRGPKTEDLMLDIAQKMASATWANCKSSRAGRCIVFLVCLCFPKIFTASSAGFHHGRARELNDYPADGTIFDFMAGDREVVQKVKKDTHLEILMFLFSILIHFWQTKISASAQKIPISLAIEMWGTGDINGKRCFDLFNPTSEMLMVSEDLSFFFLFVLQLTSLVWCLCLRFFFFKKKNTLLHHRAGFTTLCSTSLSSFIQGSHSNEAMVRSEYYRTKSNQKKTP